MKKAKKQGKRIDVLVVPKKKLLLLNIIKIVSVAAVIAGFFVPGRLQTLSLILIFSGLFFALCSSFARDYYYRCPGCGESLLKKQPLKDKIRGKVPRNCPKCSWHCNIEIR